MNETAAGYLPSGLPIPVPEPDGLSAPFWNGLRGGRLLLQRCSSCGTFQWGPEWICHACHSFDLEWEEVEPAGKIYSWTRVWHPTHPALKQYGPYLVVVVELIHPVGIRLVGNLLDDVSRDPLIGAGVRGVFEQHPEADPPYGLLQWELGQDRRLRM